MVGISISTTVRPILNAEDWGGASNLNHFAFQADLQKAWEQAADPAQATETLSSSIQSRATFESNPVLPRSV